MINIRKSNDRGHADHGWLDSRHTFSFADYYDPEHMHFRTLRVINEDYIASGAGFPTHPHRDMEIVTYVVSGTLAHRDSTGGSGSLKAGDLQHITAGSGIQHSEFNGSSTAPAHILQIWILPEAKGLKPGYSQTSLDEVPKNGALTLVASHEGGNGTLAIKQDIRLFVGKMKAGENVRHAVDAARHAWVQLISGVLLVNGVELHAGDAAGISDEQQITLEAKEASHFLLFNLG